MTRSDAALFLSIFMVASTLSPPAHAYLDPGTGSVLLQLLFGGVTGVVIVVRLYWQRIRGFLPSFLGKKEFDDRRPGP